MTPSPVEAASSQPTDCAADGETQVDVSGISHASKPAICHTSDGQEADQDAEDSTETLTLYHTVDSRTSVRGEVKVDLNAARSAASMALSALMCSTRRPLASTRPATSSTAQGTTASSQAGTASLARQKTVNRRTQGGQSRTSDEANIPALDMQTVRPVSKDGPHSGTEQPQGLYPAGMTRIPPPPPPPPRNLPPRHDHTAQGESEALTQAVQSLMGGPEAAAMLSPMAVFQQLSQSHVPSSQQQLLHSQSQRQQEHQQLEHLGTFAAAPAHMMQYVPGMQEPGHRVTNNGASWMVGHPRLPGIVSAPYLSIQGPLRPQQHSQPLPQQPGERYESLQPDELLAIRHLLGSTSLQARAQPPPTPMPVDQLTRQLGLMDMNTAPAIQRQPVRMYSMGAAQQHLMTDARLMPYSMPDATAAQQEMAIRAAQEQQQLVGAFSEPGTSQAPTTLSSGDMRLSATGTGTPAPSVIRHLTQRLQQQQQLQQMQQQQQQLQQQVQQQLQTSTALDGSMGLVGSSGTTGHPARAGDLISASGLLNGSLTSLPVWPTVPGNMTEDTATLSEAGAGEAAQSAASSSKLPPWLAAFQLACTQAALAARQQSGEGAAGAAGLLLQNLLAEHQLLLALLGMLLRWGGAANAIAEELLTLASAIQAHRDSHPQGFSSGAQLGLRLVACTLAARVAAPATPAWLQQAARLLFQKLTLQQADSPPTPAPLSTSDIVALAKVTNRHLAYLAALVPRQLVRTRTVTSAPSAPTTALRSCVMPAGAGGAKVQNSQGEGGDAVKAGNTSASSLPGNMAAVPSSDGFHQTLRMQQSQPLRSRPSLVVDTSCVWPGQQLTAAQFLWPANASGELAGHVRLSDVDAAVATTAGAAGTNWQQPDWPQPQETRPCKEAAGGKPSAAQALEQSGPAVNSPGWCSQHILSSGPGMDIHTATSPSPRGPYDALLSSSYTPGNQGINASVLSSLNASRASDTNTPVGVTGPAGNVQLLPLLSEVLGMHGAAMAPPRVPSLQQTVGRALITSTWAQPVTADLTPSQPTRAGVDSQGGPVQEWPGMVLHPATLDKHCEAAQQPSADVNQPASTHNASDASTLVSSVGNGTSWGQTSPASLQMYPSSPALSPGSHLWYTTAPASVSHLWQPPGQPS